MSTPAPESAPLTPTEPVSNYRGMIMNSRQSRYGAGVPKYGQYLVECHLVKLIVFALCLPTYGRVRNLLLTIRPSVLFMHRDALATGMADNGGMGRLERRKKKRASFEVFGHPLRATRARRFMVCLGTPSVRWADLSVSMRPRGSGREECT